MATSGTYKKYARQNRNITVEDFFNKGIFMTDTALTTGLSRNLVNFRFNPSTARLHPRGGLQPVSNEYKLTMQSEYALYYPLRSDLLTTSKDNTYTFTTLAGFDAENPASSILLPGIGGEKVLHAAANDTKIIVDNNYNLQEAEPQDLDLYFSMGPSQGISIIKDAPNFSPLPELLGCTILNTFIGLRNTYASAATAEDRPGYLYKYDITEYRQGDADRFDIQQERIVPMSLDAAFAVNYGYNMLASDPYTFEDKVSQSGAYVLNGLLPQRYNSITGAYVLTTDYRNGQKIRFKLNWEFPAGVVGVKFEWRLASSDTWDTTTRTASRYNTYTIREGTNDPIYCDIQVPEEAFQIKVTVFGVTAGNTIDESDIKAMAIYSFSGARAEDTTTKPELVNYDLCTAQGILSWKRRICLYGVTEAPNILFLSDIDTPAYFPYPNNIVEYDYPILKVINYLDDLLVFTTDGVYQTELGSDGLTYITKQVVGNVHFTTNDIYSIQVVKNMLFYKAGARYYMLVPSSKYLNTGQLQTAPVSAPIDYLLDNFIYEFKKVFQDMYGSYFKDTENSFIESDTSIMPTSYSTFVEGDLIKINYGFFINNTKVGCSVHIVYTLIYDTLNRLWLSDITELATSRMINVYRKNLLGLNQYILTDTYERTDSDGHQYTILNFAIVQNNNNTNVDFVFEGAENVLPTRQFIDTGFRDINIPLKKRFRELQIKLSTPFDTAIFMQPNVSVDDMLRNDNILQTVYFNGEVYIINNTEEYIVAPGAQYLEEPLGTDTPDYTRLEGTPVYKPNGNDLFFKLGQEYLTAQHLNTVRFRITGKGYCPRLQLNMHTKTPYELQSIAWVFRNMNAR